MLSRIISAHVAMAWVFSISRFEAVAPPKNHGMPRVMTATPIPAPTHRVTATTSIANTTAAAHQAVATAALVPSGKNVEASGSRRLPRTPLDDHEQPQGGPGTQPGHQENAHARTPGPSTCHTPGVSSHRRSKPARANRANRSSVNR